MNPPNRPPWVRQLENDEALWAAYEKRRTGNGPLLSRFAEALDRVAWQSAEREVERVVEAHGHWADEGR